MPRRAVCCRRDLLFAGTGRAREQNDVATAAQEDLRGELAAEVRAKVATDEADLVTRAHADLL